MLTWGTYGAAIGAYIVIGLLKGCANPKDEQSQEVAYNIIGEFNSEFIKINTSIQSRELLEKDVTLPDDMEDILWNKLFDINFPNLSQTDVG